MATNGKRQIVLIRHGQTDWNLESKAQGHADIPLNVTGHAQAALMGRYVREQMQIDRVFSSDLKRCTQTADALDMPYEQDSRLREFDTGDLTGKNWDDIKTGHSDVLADLQYSRTWARRPNGESDFDATARAAGFIHESGILKQDSTWALVSHGGLIRRIICVLLDLPLAYSSKLTIDNTSITVLSQSIDDPGAEIVLDALNFTGHLER